MFYVYLARSLKNGKIYVGFTSKNPPLRVDEHNQGANRWSKANRPLKLVYFESFICKEDAKLREKFFKTQWGRNYLRRVLKNYWKQSGS